MYQRRKIDLSSFTDAFQRLSWRRENSRSGEYFIWNHPSDQSIWTVLPKNLEASDYLYYQDKNIKMLLFALDWEENEYNYDEIYSQLLNYNYKIINRIVSNIADGDSAPYEIATLLPTKNVDAFRTYYQIKTGAKHTLPIENFQFNHTQHGSFIIPISIIAQNSDQTTLEVVSSETNYVLHEYLEKIEKLISLSPSDQDHYAKEILENEIDSKLVKDFLNQTDSIAKYRAKYSEQVKEITISGKSSPFLDYALTSQQKTFPTVDLSDITPLDNEFILAIERLEVEADSTALNEAGIKIKAIIDGVDANGKAKFRVVEVGGETYKKSFKAVTTELTRERLNVCADAFKSFLPVEITGDIVKKKGKIAKIIVGDLALGKKSPSLFDQEVNEASIKE